MKISSSMIITLIVLLSVHVNAQNFPWNAYFGNEGAEFVYDIKQTQDQGYIIAAYANNGGSSDFYVVKLDMYGSLDWERNISKDNYSERAFSILQSGEGNYIVVGNATNFNKPWIVKLDASGETLWTTAWTDTIANNTGLLSRGALLPDGRIVVISHEDYYALDPYMFIVSSDGDLLEERDLESLVPLGWFSGTVINDIETTNDGGFILTGATGGGTGSRAYLWKFDANADSIWSVIYDGPEMGMRSAQSVKQLSDGGYIMTGFTAPNSTTTAAIRADSNGNFLWFQSYPDTIYTQGTDVIEWKSGEFLITEKRFSGFGANFFQSNLLRIDSVGNMLSRDMIMASDSSTTISQMRPTADGGFVIAGEINEYLSVGEQDLFVLKSDSLGNIDNLYIDYVWPGDVNYDGEVNMDDLMILGVTAGGEGPARQDTSLDWYAHYVTDWADTVVTGVNFKHADTDGNGTIDILDTLAISLNFGFSHTIPSKSSAAMDEPVLRTEPDEITTDDNFFVHIPIYLGMLNDPVQDLYGLKFRIVTDKALFELSSSWIETTNSWLIEDPSNVLDLSQSLQEEGIMEYGFTRINHSEISGYGIIGYLHLKLIENSITPGEEITFDLSFENGAYNNYNLETTVLGSSSYTITLNNTTTGIASQKDPDIQVYPNPVTGALIYVVPAKTFTEISLHSMDGRYYPLQKLTDNGQIALPEGLPSGLYILNAVDRNGERIWRKLMVR